MMTALVGAIRARKMMTDATLKDLSLILPSEVDNSSAFDPRGKKRVKYH